MENPEKFRNTIITGDRAYFCYVFMDFLIESGINFVIRARGDACNLEPDSYLAPSAKDRDIILKLRKRVRIIKCKSIREKIVYDVKIWGEM